MATQKQNLEDLFATITRLFSPRIIAEVNDVYVKIVKIKGQDVPWHTHEREDELFFVLKGRMTVERKGRPPLDLEEGELIVVRKGMEHRVYSDQECRLMLIENKSTRHTGEVKSRITKTVEEQRY